MSIQSEINRIKSNIASTYSALSSLGATIPNEQNSDNLPGTASAIAVIHVFAGSSDPNSDIGVDGDIYIKI